MTVDELMSSTTKSLAAIAAALGALVALLAARKPVPTSSPHDGIDSTPPSGMQEEAVKTALTFEEARYALENAYERAEGHGPSSRALAMLLAQSALETAKWQKMFCWNFGNITTSSGPYFLLAKDRKHRYRVYRSRDEGADAFLELLRTRYAEAWAVLDEGSPGAYATALKARGYYEAPVNSYTKALGSWYPSFLASLTTAGGTAWS